MPRHKRVDQILLNIGDDIGNVPDGECPYDEGDDEGAQEDDSGGSDEEDVAGEAEANDHDWVAEGAAVAADAMPTKDAKEADGVQVLDKESSEQLDFAKENLRIYAEVADCIQATGNHAAINSIRNAIHKEEKKIRALSKEHPEVLATVAQIKAAEDATVRKRMLAVQDANDKMKALCDINREIAEANRKLKRQRAACQDAEAAAHVKNSVRKYS